MTRIFLTLASLSSLLLLAAFCLGWMIGDAATAEAQPQVAWHFLTAVGALVFAALVHAIVLTYFMGTGRWIEETTRAYRLPEKSIAENQALKYRLVLAMTGCLLLLILTGGFGAAADPAAPAGFKGWRGISSATIHFLIAVTTVGLNSIVYLWEYQSIEANGVVVNEVLQQVHAIRKERGLPVGNEADAAV
jgi:heme/copper-type cytochrome/quinol oxidase subunit 2